MTVMRIKWIVMKNSSRIASCRNNGCTNVGLTNVMDACFTAVHLFAYLFIPDYLQLTGRYGQPGIILLYFFLLKLITPGYISRTNKIDLLLSHPIIIE